MSAAWSDAYVLAVADQLARDFGPSRPDLLEKTPSLPFTELDELLERARALGATIEGGMPEETTAPPETAPVVAALRPIVDRIRAAGAQHFDPIERYDFYVTCTTAWPLVHMLVPEPGGPDMGKVELLNLGDTPPAHPAWTSRARAIEHPSLRVLYLYGDAIESATGIALGRLPALEFLDLGDNRLRTLPPEVLECQALRTLKLTMNPIRTLPDLSPLVRLRYLEISSTAITPDVLGAVRAQLPECLVVAGHLEG
jgi:Leucine-rich repeat (LRR) protein